MRAATDDALFEVGAQGCNQIVRGESLIVGGGVTGIANFPNGEMPRVASATPTPYLARLYVAHDFGFGADKESIESDENQLAGERPATRYTIVTGRFNPAYNRDRGPAWIPTVRLHVELGKDAFRHH